MDELLEGVIHSQKGELEMRKAEFVDLQVGMGVGGAELQDCCTGVVGTRAFGDRWLASLDQLPLCWRDGPRAVPIFLLTPESHLDRPLPPVSALVKKRTVNTVSFSCRCSLRYSRILLSIG